MRITIQPNDNLSTIAQKNGTTVSEILRLNPQITDPNKIRAGASIMLPGEENRELPDVGMPASEKDLPEAPQGGRLLRFANAMKTAMNIAKGKRIRYQTDVLGENVAPGIRRASDFSSIISGLDSVDTPFVEDLTDTAIDEVRTDIEDIQDIARTAAENGAPQAVVDQILSADNAQRALVKAGSWMKTPEKPKPGPADPLAKKIIDGTLITNPVEIDAMKTWLRTGIEIDGVRYNPRGGDGYVDPDLYQKLATNWEEKGGTIDGFKKYFPPKTYINPANQALPTYLRSKIDEKKGDTLDDLFGN